MAEAVITAPAASARSSRISVLVAGSLGARLVCFAAMNAVAVWFEARPAPTLPDALVSRIPYLPWVDRYNYLLWAICVLPLAIAMLAANARRFCRYNLAAGVLDLLRGLCIAATGFGPVRGPDLHAGMGVHQRLEAFVSLISLGHLGPAFALTKDLFFSGHTATTCLLLLYLWRFPRLRWLALLGHLLVVASVFLAHLHYTVDVLGAYAFTVAVFLLFEHR